MKRDKSHCTEPPKARVFSLIAQRRWREHLIQFEFIHLHSSFGLIFLLRNNFDLFTSVQSVIMYFKTFIAYPK